MSVVLELADEIDLARGGMIADPLRPPQLSSWLRSTLIWMHHDALEVAKTYLLRHGPHEVRARVQRVVHRVDMDELREREAATLGLNDVGLVVLETTEPIVFDAYAKNRTTGAFILIDPISNLTLAAGMIEAAAEDPAARARLEKTIEFHQGPLLPQERRRRSGHRGFLVIADPESSLAQGFERKLFSYGADVLLLTKSISPLDPLLDAGLIVIAPPGTTPDGVHPQFDARGLAPEQAFQQLVDLGLIEERKS